MSRPVYESSTDRENEAHIASRLIESWGGHLQKLPHHQHIDYAHTSDDGRVLGLVEVKARRFVWGQYPDVMLSASKIRVAWEWFQSLGLATAFVVADRTFDIRFVMIAQDQFPVSFGGRTAATRDSQDVELIASIPIELFTPIGQPKKNSRKFSKGIAGGRTIV